MRDKMFSILVVSLNAGEKLKQTIQSILEQDYTDYEVVVKDGGSKDDSLEKTKNNLIFVEHCSPFSRAEIDEKLEALKACLHNGNSDIVKTLRSIVPTFKTPDYVNENAADSKEMKDVITAMKSINTTVKLSDNFPELRVVTNFEAELDKEMLK